jgi:hypothetical protein
MNCDQVRLLLCALADGELSWLTAARLRWHAALCGACSAERVAARRLDGRLAALRHPARPESLRLRLAAAVPAAPSLSRRAAGPAAFWAGPGRRKSMLGVSTALAAMAAAAVLVTGTGERQAEAQATRVRAAMSRVRSAHVVYRTTGRKKAEAELWYQNGRYVQVQRVQGAPARHSVQRSAVKPVRAAAPRTTPAAGNKPELLDVTLSLIGDTIARTEKLDETRGVTVSDVLIERTNVSGPPVTVSDVLIANIEPKDSANRALILDLTVPSDHVVLRNVPAVRPALTVDRHSKVRPVVSFRLPSGKADKLPKAKDKSSTAEEPDKAAKADRAEKLEKPGKAEKADKPEKAEKPERAQKPGKAEKPEKAEKARHKGAKAPRQGVVFWTDAVTALPESGDTFVFLNDGRLKKTGEVTFELNRPVPDVVFKFTAERDDTAPRKVFELPLKLEKAAKPGKIRVAPLRRGEVKPAPSPAAPDVKR